MTEDNSTEESSVTVVAVKLGNYAQKGVIKISKPVTDIPKTGDTTNMPLWAALAGISAIGAGAAAFFTFRKKKEVGKHER